MARTVSEWTGKNDDADPPANIKRRIAVRANYTCQICGRECKHGRGDVDHIKPLWDGGKNKESNLAWVCRVPCHRGKSVAEAKQRTLAHKAQKSVAGIKEQSAWSKYYHEMKSRGWSPWKRRMPAGERG